MLCVATAVTTLFLPCMTPGTVPAGEEEQKDGPTPIETVIKKSLGNKLEILRIDAPEPSPVQG